MDDLLIDYAEPLGFLLSLVFLVIWIACLVNAAKSNQWVWFVVILVLGVTALVYLAVAYKSPKKLRAAAGRARRRSSRELASRDREIETLEREVGELKEQHSDAPSGDRS